MNQENYDIRKINLKHMNTVLLFGMPGGMEWVLIIFVIVLLFGAKKIPDLARGLGQGIREFKDAQKEITDQLNQKPGEFKKPA